MAALTLTDLLSFFYARGFDWMSDGGAGATRATRFINDALHALDDAERWPYLIAASSTTAVAPLTITDLDGVDSVTFNNVPLVASDINTLTEWYGDLTTTGTPQYFYMSAATTVSVYPVSTAAQLFVKYWKVAPDLSAGSDAPLMPDRYRMGIVDYACALAFREANVPDEAQIAQAAGDAVLSRMRQGFSLLPGRRYQKVLGNSDDW